MRRSASEPGLRWFCRLGLEDAVPDHSTFSKNRHGLFRDNDTLRFVFEKVLERCLSEGLVGGEGFAIDASVIKADASRQRGAPGTEAGWDRESSLTRPIREYMEALDAADEPRKAPKNVSLTDPAAQWTAAPLKRILRLDRLRLRDLKGARDEFLLAATAQNLRRMAAWLMPKGPGNGNCNAYLSCEGDFTPSFAL